MESETKQRVHIWVKGRVQGVGFRSYVEDHALQMGVRGWVRNFGDDTVETVAEGTKSAIDAFVQMVKKGPPVSRVDEARVEFEEPIGILEGFTVKRSR